MELEKEILKKVVSCSRCGLCQDVCPIFKVKKEECSLARGKFLQLLGVLKGDLKLSRKIMQNLDMCLYCGKCTSHCPSQIDAAALFSDIRAQKNTFFDNFLNYKIVFKLKMLFLNSCRIFKKQKKIVLPQNALFFKGCIKSSIKVSTKSPFKCCALPFFVKGRKKVYEKYVRHNMSIIEKTDADIYFDCATCFDMVRSYPFSEPKVLGRLKMLNELIVAPEKKIKVTFHKPCHLKDDLMEEALLKLENIEYVPLSANQCCGFGGDFFIRHPFVAHILSLKKAKEIYEVNVDIVYSACPTCIWSLKWGLFYLRMKSGNKLPKIKTLDIATLLP